MSGVYREPSSRGEAGALHSILFSGSLSLLAAALTVLIKAERVEISVHCVLFKFPGTKLCCQDWTEQEWKRPGWMTWGC